MEANFSQYRYIPRPNPSTSQDQIQFNAMSYLAHLNEKLIFLTYHYHLKVYSLVLNP